MGISEGLIHDEGPSLPLHMKSVPITACQFSTAGGEEYLVHLYVLRMFCYLRQVSGFQENGLPR
jgi:hypothetical protein